MAEFHIPTNQEFADEILAGVDALDSLDIAEVEADLSEVDGDNEEQDLVDMLERIFEAGDLDGDSRKRIFRAILLSEIPFETTSMGVPITITPREEASPEPPKPDESGDREPRVPIPPAPVDGISVEVA